MESWQNMLAYAKCGLQYLTPGGSGPLRAHIDGSLYVKQGGKYSNAALAGRVFNVANQAGVANTAAFAATFTGLAIGNPLTSGVNCSLLNFGYGTTVVGVSVGTVGIMGGPSGLCPITASLTIQNANQTGPLSKCTATAGQTINAAPAPTLLRVCGITGTGAVTTWQTQPCSFDIDGAIIIPPGYFWAAYTFALGTAALQFSFTWEESPV